MLHLEYGVPRTTSKDRISGWVVHGTNMGTKSCLNKEEETELVDFLITYCNAGYGKTRKAVQAIVGTIAQKKGLRVDGHISDGWWSRFRQRWPQLRLRKGDLFPLVRMEITNVEVFDSYFNLLEETLLEHGIKDKPAQIYNCDESGMPLEHKMPKVIALKGAKKVRQNPDHGSRLC